ncbi:MAG: CcmD family protein, partial [Flavobacteriales bacterium]
MKYRCCILLTFLVLSGTSANAQADQLTDIFYSSGKIYVVTGSLLLILAGIIFYLVRLDRKIKRIEKDMEDQRS